MTNLKRSFLAVSMLALLGGAAAAGAQMHHGHGGAMPMPAAAHPSMTDGEVRKIDREQAKITLRHGDIRNLDMPGMTMVFKVRNPGLLDKVKVGDRISFFVVMEQGGMVITEIQPAS